MVYNSNSLLICAFGKDFIIKHISGKENLASFSGSAIGGFFAPASPIVNTFLNFIIRSAQQYKAVGFFPVPLKGSNRF